MTDDRVERPTELRLALGMRGGVSLAVWIGGACAEIDHLRRCGEVEGSLWSAALDVSPYDGVVVDVIAGASAGGLNGVLYAASQRYGFRLSGVRQLWLRLGDLRGLVRTTGDGGTGARALSLLDGDGRFLDPLQESLATMIREGVGSASTPPSSVDLRLSATHVDPVVRRVPSPVDETLVERRSAAELHFRHIEGQPWLHSDLPPVSGPDDPGIEPIAWRLALAARASSSYPVAFEAAVVRARRAATFAAGPDVTADGRLADMGGIFSDRTSASCTGAPGSAPEPLDFTVMDGGVLDNIPLGKALRAVAGVPATTPTRRMLVYVQPGVAGDGEPALGAAASLDARRSTMSVLKGAVGALVAGESIADDVAQLEAHNDGIERAATMRLGTLVPAVRGVAGGPPGLVAAATAAWGTYEPLRADFDARLVRSLLDDPIATFGSDPFPRTVGGRQIPDECWRSPIARWQASERERLVPALAGSFGARLQGGAASFEARRVVLAGVRPLVRTVTLLLEWARHLEARGVPEASPAKQVLYRVLLLVEHVLDRPRRLGWVALAAASTPDTTADAWVREAGTAVNRLLQVSPDVAEGIVADLRSGGSADIGRHHADVLGRLDLVLDPAEPDDGAEDLREHLFTFLAEVADRLRTAADRRAVASVADADGRGDGLDAEERAQAQGALLDGALRAQQVTVDVLAALEVVCFPEFVAGTPGQRRIDFVRLSAGNRTPLAPWFAALATEASRTGLHWTPPRGTEGRVPAADGVPLALKLAGNELKNFAAFLKPEWRANDWMWGRLDAVPTLVDILVTPEAMRTSLAGAPTHDLAVAAVREIVVGATDPAWRTWLTENVWTTYRPLVEAEVRALRTGESAPTVFAIRDAVVVRRQWEILAEELAAPVVADAGGPDHGPVAPLPPEATVARARDHTCGFETVMDPKDRRHAEVAATVCRVAGDAVAVNVELLRRSPDGGGPLLRERLARGVGTVVRVTGPIAAHAVLAPDSDQRGLVGALRRPPRWLVVAPTGAAIGLSAFALRRSPAATGAALAAVALAPVSVALRTLRSLSSTAPARPGGVGSAGHGDGLGGEQAPSVAATAVGGPTSGDASTGAALGAPPGDQVVTTTLP